MIRSPTLTASDQAFRVHQRQLLQRFKATGVVYRARVLGTSADRHAVLIGIQRQEDVDRLLSAVEQSDGQDGFSVVMTGERDRSITTSTTLSQHDLKSGELSRSACPPR